MADNVFDVQGKNQTIADLQQFAQNVEASLQAAGAAFGGMEDVLREALQRSIIQRERLEEEKILLQNSGRDTYDKIREIEAESKKIEIIEKGVSTGAAFKGLQSFGSIIDKLKQSGDSMKDEMGAAYGQMRAFFERILPKKQFTDFTSTFEKEFRDLKTDAERADHVKRVQEIYAALATTAKDVASGFVKDEGAMLSLLEEDTKRLRKETFAFMEKWFGLKEQGRSFFSMLGTAGPEGYQAVAAAIQSVITPQNIMAAGMTKILGITKKLVVELDELYAGYTKMGGLIENERGGMFGGTITEAAGRNRALGMGKESSFSAAAGLQQSFSQFSTLSESGRSDLIETAAQLEVVGVSAQTTGKLMTTFTKQFGKSASESMDIITDMEQYGRSIGVTSSKMMEDMAASMDTLSAFGEKSVQIFKELAKEAKRTGIEVATLVGLEERFMTFDASAELAGKMNAMAGRVVLDPMQLMLATGEEKQALIRQAAESLAIDPNNARSVKYAANALGISPAEFQKLIGDKDSPEQQATSLQEVVKMSISMGQKLKAILENIAVAAQPILWVLQKLFTILAAVMGSFDGWTGSVILWGAAIYLLATKWSLLGSVLKGTLGIAKVVTGALSGAAQAATTTAAALPPANAALGATGVTAGATGPVAFAGLVMFAKGLLFFSLAAIVFAAAVFVIAAAFTVFSLGILVLVKAANSLEEGAMGNLALGLIALGAAMVVFGAEMMLASVFTALGIPAFIQLTALLAVLATTVPTVAPLMSTFATGLRELGSAFRDFMGSMVMESGSGVINAVKGFFGFKSSGSGFSAFVTTMNTLKKTVGSIPEGSLSSIAEFLRSISNFKFAQSPFESMVKSLQELVWMLDSLPEDKMISLTSNMETLSSVSGAASDFTHVLEAVGNISAEKVELVKNVVSSAQEYYNSSKVSSITQAPAPQKKEEAVVTLEIDGREVAEAIIPLIEGRLASKYFQDTLYE